MSVTAKEIAKELNISAAAVSMALNNKPGVSTKTRKIIFEKAREMGYDFSIRLNGTSDISPLAFKDKRSGKNILELFPNVQFYDYTKVFNRINLLEKYPNYDLTFSFDGYNWDECEKFLQGGGKVAVVFYSDKNKLPQYYKGYKVVDANENDMRYLDEKGTIMGLHYHKTANDYKSGHFVRPNTPFVIDLDKGEF